MTAPFWQSRRVFVTGHTGFKGSWLSLWLQQLGAEVIGYALPPPTDPSLFALADVAGGMTSIIGDVRDLGRVTASMRDHQPEIVIHMAAQALVHDSFEHPVETFSTNVLGTVNVLEAVRACGSVRAVLCITSDKCYENREWVWGYREDDPLGGHDPYSSSKACAELAIDAYRHSFFTAPSPAGHHVAVASARAGNVIGGGDWGRNRLIPDIMRGILDGRPVVIRNPHATRPWQHVLAPLRGYLLLAERLVESGQPFAESWNFGPDHEDVRPVQWLADYLTTAWGDGARWELDGRSHPPEHTYLSLDASKAKARLRWTPPMRLPATLDLIVEWYRAYAAGASLKDVTEAQIARQPPLDATLPVRHLEPPGAVNGPDSQVAAATP